MIQKQESAETMNYIIRYIKTTKIRNYRPSDTEYKINVFKERK